MGHILMDGKPTIESDGHIVASRRPLHICSKFFLHTLVVVGDGSIIRFGICGGGLTFVFAISKSF